MKKWLKHNARHVRGGLGVLFGVLAQAVYGQDINAIATWTAKRWALGILMAGLPGLVGWIAHGDPNPPDVKVA